MLKKLEGYIITSDSVKEFVKEAERMIRRYGWQDATVHPYEFPMKVTKIIRNLKDYDKCTRCSKDYLVDLANGLARIMNKWEECEQEEKITVRIIKGASEGKVLTMAKSLADDLVEFGFGEVVSC